MISPAFTSSTSSLYNNRAEIFEKIYFAELFLLGGGEEGEVRERRKPIWNLYLNPRLLH